MDAHQDKELSSDLPPLPEPLELIWPDLNLSALGCGIEDRGIRDRYEAAEYGWQCGVDRAIECVPDGLYDADQMREYARAAVALATSPQLPVAEQPAGQAAMSDAEILAVFEQYAGHFLQTEDDDEIGLDSHQAIDIGRHLLAAPHSPVAQMSGDAVEAAELQTYLTVNCGESRPGYPAGLYAWAHKALQQSASDLQAMQSVAEHNYAAASHPSNAVQDAHTAFMNWKSQRGEASNYQGDGVFTYIEQGQWEAFLAGIELNRGTSAATVPQVVQAPIGYVGQGQLAAWKHTGGSISLWQKPFNDYTIPVYATAQPVAASPSIVPIGQLALTAARKIRESIAAGDQSGMTIQRIIDDVFTTTSNAGEAAQGEDK